MRFGRHRARRGATAGPFLLAPGDGAPAAVAVVAVPTDDPEFEYVEPGRLLLTDDPVPCGASGAAEISRYVAGTSPSLYPSRTLTQPDPSGLTCEPFLI